MAVAFLCLQLNSISIMGKQKKIVEVPVTSEEKRRELQTIRMTFVCLLMMIVNGGQDEVVNFLKDKDAKAIREYAEIWAKCATDPVGAICQHPAFELMANIKDTIKE
jgi:hypothetical protein